MRHAKGTSSACGSQSRGYYEASDQGDLVVEGCRSGSGFGLHLAWATRVICRPARRINHIAHYCSQTVHIRDWFVWGKGVAASKHSRLGVNPSHQPVRAVVGAHGASSRWPSAQASILEQSSPASCKAKVAVTSGRPCRPPPPPSSSRLRHHARSALDESSSFTSTCSSSATPRARPLHLVSQSACWIGVLLRANSLAPPSPLSRFV